MTSMKFFKVLQERPTTNPIWAVRRFIYLRTSKPNFFVWEVSEKYFLIK